MKTSRQAGAALALVLGMAAAVGAATKHKKSAATDTSVQNTFYVYSDKGARVNHFIPSGWMGDYGDLKLDDSSTTDPADGKTCIKITYNGKAAQGANWAGIFWQHPANNWGEKPGGFDLSSFKRLTFSSRGEQSGEKVTEFKVGGITGEHGDSNSACT